MGLLNPLLLAALGALAVPIFLHLVRRREGRTMDFPAVRYLRRTTREHARIIRLRQLLLLALRMAAVILLVLAGAGLILPLGGRDHPPAGLVLVVDNGVSSGAVLGDGRVLDSLIARGRSALERTGERDRIWVVEAGRPWRPAVPLSPGEARGVLSEIEPTHVTSDLPAQLRRAGALLDASGLALREIVLLSDLRPRAVSEVEPGGAPREDVVHVARPPEAPQANRGIAELQIAGGLTPVSGEAAELYVRVLTDGSDPTVVRVYLEERLVASGQVGPGNDLALSLPPLPTGWVHGRVELDPDDLRADDTAYFAFRVVEPPRVRVGEGVSPYVLDALTTLEGAGRVRLGTDADADVHIVATDALPTPPPSASVVVMPPDDPAVLPSTNRLLQTLLPGWRLSPRDPGDGVERRIETGSAVGSLPERPGIRRTHAIETGTGDVAATELLGLSDGSAWLVQARAADRTVLVLGSALDRASSDVPLSTAMVPLVDLLTLPRGSEGGARAVHAGTPIPVPAGATVVETPDGTLHPLDGMSSFSRTGVAGIHRFRSDSDEIVAKVAVNPRSPEPPLIPEEAVQRLSAGFSDVRAPDAWPGTLLDERRGREVSLWLLAALVGVLLLEMWLAASATGTPGVPAAGPSTTTSSSPGSRHPRTRPSTSRAPNS